MGEFYNTDAVRSLEKVIKFIKRDNENVEPKDIFSLHEGVCAIIKILSDLGENSYARVVNPTKRQKSEPVGIGPGGYDPTKDTDITGV